MTDTVHIKPLLDIRAFVAGDTNQEELLAAYLAKHSKLSLDDYNEALAFINTCLQEEPNHTQALIASAVLQLQLLSNESNSTALNYLDKAIAQGSSFAKVVKGICLRNGIGIAKDLAEAVRLFRTASAAGNSSATYRLAVCYDNGIGVTKDPAEAVRLYRIASDRGNTNATTNLAFCYLEGIGLTKDPAEGVSLLRIASAAGNIQATTNLAICLRDGIGITKDAAEAVSLFRIASAAGNIQATCNLAICCLNGTGVTKDPAEGVRFYRIASDAGDGEATFDLAVCYQDGVGTIKNLAEAVKLYHLAIKQGYDRAAHNLAYYYDNGIGIAKDAHEATRLYHIASTAGNSESTNFLALRSKKGIDCVRNTAEAVRLFRIASDAGNSSATYNLAGCYYDGIGIAKDLVEATKLYIKAINSNTVMERHQVRFKDLVDCLEELKYQGINPGVLAKWCAKMRKTLHDNSNCLGYIKKILQRLMAIYTKDDVVQYHAIMALYASSWGARVFTDYIRKLIDQEPNKFMTFLIHDKILLPAEKKKYYEYIQATHLKTLSGEHIYVILYELNLLPTLRANRNFYFSVLPPSLLEDTAKKVLSPGTSTVDEDIELSLTRSLSPTLRLL